MSLPKLKLSIRKGGTVEIPIRVAGGTLAYKAITAISRSAPVSITAPAHGMKDGLLGAVIDAGGMREINAEGVPPDDSELRPVTVVTDDVVQFNTVSSARYRAYTSGGYLVYYAPLDLAGFVSARMSVKHTTDDTTEFLSFTTDNSRLELDSTTQTLWLRMSAADSAAITETEGVFDIELVDGSGDVTPICSAESEIAFLPEVTT